MRFSQNRKKFQRPLFCVGFIHLYAFFVFVHTIYCPKHVQDNYTRSPPKKQGGKAEL
jgi:hypothetical protein